MSAIAPSSAESTRPPRDGNWWIARVQVNGRRIERSGFSTAERAAEAYAQLARAHFGEFARLS